VSLIVDRGTLNIRICDRRRAWLACLLAALCFPAAARGQRSQMPTAATDATVKWDAVTVFHEMDASSEQTSTLKKGSSVYVDLRIDQGGRIWCGVRPSRQTSRIGFVDCKSLERIADLPPPATSPLGVLTSEASRAAAEIPLVRPATPTANGYAAMKTQVVKEGVIDSGYIATLEAQAASGNSSAVTRAALAHLAAGEFELSQHKPDEAIEHFQAMEPFAGRQRDLVLASLDGQVYGLLMKSEFSPALELIEKARRLSPQSAKLAALSGWTHYRLDQMDAAIADLQTAQRIRPDTKVAGLLEKAERDKEAENDFKEGESQHFVLRYHGGASRQLASEVIYTLEEQFQSLQAELRYTPAEPIAVILYTREAFRDVTHVPDWAGALNDGRIRVPVQGMEKVSPPLAISLKHELTHSFLFQKTQGRCPSWLHEGIAQWMTGRRTGESAAQLVAMFESGKGKSLRTLEGPWLKFSSSESWFAYGWSLAAVESIEGSSGADGLDRLLNAERTESSGEAALLEALRTNYSSLDDATVEYLHRTYLQ